MPFWQEREQTRIDTRAIEMSAATDAVMTQHLTECRDRYLAVSAELDAVHKLAQRGLVFIVVLLLTILGYLVSHGGIPMVHTTWLT